MDLDRIRYLYDGLPTYEQSRYRMLLYHFWKPVEVDDVSRVDLVRLPCLCYPEVAIQTRIRLKLGDCTTERDSLAHTKTGDQTRSSSPENTEGTGKHFETQESNG